MKYAISLGNSNLGRLAISYLLEKGVAASDIVAVVRSVERAADLADKGIDVRYGDYDNATSFVSALKGVQRLYMISGMAPPETRIMQHDDVINAAGEAGVEHIAYTSFMDCSEESPFFAWRINKKTEQSLKDSGIAYTILRSGMYSEADLDYIPTYLKLGKVANNIGPEGLISYISRRDLALAGVICLAEDGHGGKTYTLTGPEAITQVQLAKLISTWTSTDIPYETLGDEEYARQFSDPHWADVVVTLYASVRLGNMAMVADDFKTIVGRDAYTLQETWDRFYR